MFGGFPMLEAAGPRVVSHCPPRGTPSRVLATRLQRRPTLHPRLRRAALTSLPTSRNPVGACCRAFSTSTGILAETTRITDDDVLFVSRLVQSYGHQAPHDSIVDRVNEALRLGPQPMTELGREPNGTVAEPSTASLNHTPDLVETLPRLFGWALEAMRQRDSTRLLYLLRQIARLPQDELGQGVAALPRTTFSEFLRALDPLANGLRDDPTRGVHIGIGMWQILSMDQLVDEWGVRTLYSKLLRQLLVVMRALQVNGWKLSINDYTPLIRAAGLSSDHVVAKILWEQIRNEDISRWRHSNAYREFVRARLLVHPAYSGHDKTRLMVAPRQMQMRRRVSCDEETAVPLLDVLRLKTRRRSFKFGLNKNKDYAEELRQIMSGELPARRLFYYMILNGFRFDEDLLCIFMIGFARAGNLEFVNTSILQDYFGIYIKEDSDGQIRAGPLGNISRASNEFFRPRTATMRPTERLIEAVVEAYCCNGQLSAALVAIDYISTRYQITISSKVWCELIEWAYVLASPPHSTSWQIPGLDDRVPGPESVEMIWNVMTSPPYNVQPGFKQYDVMIKSLIHRKKPTQAIEYMRTARKLYNTHCEEYENAALQVYRARRERVNCAEITRKFQRAHFLKEHMWLRMNGWCDSLSNSGFDLVSNGERAARTFPDFIKEWREFVSNPVRYETPTGYVQLRDPSEPVIKRHFLRGVTLNIPMSADGELVKSEKKKQYRFYSKHSLGSLAQPRVDPLTVLRGKHRTQRHQWRLRYRKGRALPAARPTEDASSAADSWEDDDDW